ncbi:MAG: hypothetical protein ACRDM7_19675 [Thermoleophilaceae bacterium]
MADRLRELIDLVLDSLDEPGADGRALAERAHFSRDHLDRLLAAATGESPVALRRRLLLERAAWQLRGAWDDAFVDALCEPPQSFTYGGVISHVLSYGAVRREALAGVLRELGARVPSSGDPIDWEAARGAESRIR